jgi:hypothetical protein
MIIEKEFSNLGWKNAPNGVAKTNYIKFCRLISRRNSTFSFQLRTPIDQQGAVLCSCWEAVC